MSEPVSTAEPIVESRLGNVQFRGGSQNFNPSFAKAARVAIAFGFEERGLDEIVSFTAPANRRSITDAPPGCPTRSRRGQSRKSIG